MWYMKHKCVLLVLLQQSITCDGRESLRVLSAKKQNKNFKIGEENKLSRPDFWKIISPPLSHTHTYADKSMKKIRLGRKENSKNIFNNKFGICSSLGTLHKLF